MIKAAAKGVGQFIINNNCIQVAGNQGKGSPARTSPAEIPTITADCDKSLF
jgi:hypothetical protein